MKVEYQGNEGFLQRDIRVHRKSLAKTKEKLKLLTKRNRGRNVRAVMQEVKVFVRG